MSYNNTCCRVRDDALDAADERIAELEAALRAIVDFNDGPTERKRPDIYSLLLMRARNVLDASKTEGR